MTKAEWEADYYEKCKKQFEKEQYLQCDKEDMREVNNENHR